MIGERESAGYLVGETTHLVRADAGLAVAALGTLTALGVAADLSPGFAGPAGFGSLIANLLFQYEISLALLAHYGLLEGGGRRRIWALLGLNLLSGIAILFGLVLLVVPGIYLLVRWSAAVPALIAEDSDVTGSLGLSAEAVDGRFWHVLAAMLVVWSPSVAGMLASAFAPEDQQLISSVVMNLSLNLSLIAGWHLAVAVYAGRQTGNRLAEVFA
ncbi:MAG TPA: hypothetical protein VF548_10120 [Allosphingosinicella sp.]|jgi:hypothetical protein